MLRITVEIVPMGNEADKRTIGVMHVINDGSGSLGTGNYKVHEMLAGDCCIGYNVPAIERHTNIFYFLADLFAKRKKSMKAVPEK